jgi:hypothetical protein
MAAARMKKKISLTVIGLVPLAVAYDFRAVLQR